ncbi:MAG: cyclic nucleotide-binding domain-containing protein [Ardenticatenales bacterium]|nr:cyclic nucleotide-binding domain-containing protein [Ardenticatenales bacterium]
MTDPNSLIDLFALGQSCLTSFIQEFESYGITADPRLTLLRGKGVLCYYDFKDGNIYLSTPDLSDPKSKLQMLFMRSILRCDSNEELFEFLGLFIPQVIAHELAHHFRHRYGLFGDNLWHEEQVANQLAMAVTKHRLSPPEKEKARDYLHRALEGLSEKMEAKNIAADSYRSIVDALNTAGQIGTTTVENLERMQKIFALDPEDMLRDSGQLSDELLQRLERRDDIIDEINEDYASDYIRYMYYHVGWVYLDVTGRSTHYVEEFARIYLDRRVDLLPPVEPSENPSENEIYACYRAYQDTAPISEAAGYYFYKRYRSLLLAKLQSIELSTPTQTQQLQREAAFLLENWNGQEGDSLSYLSQLAPPPARVLFPNAIAEHLDPKLPMQLYLPTETDKRLWKHVFLKEKDESAANTLHRLSLLDQTDIYKPLPAEVLLGLVQNFCRIYLNPDEIIIWEGEINDDVYILIQGELAVSVTQDGQPKRVGTIRPGEVFGEMAFFTREPRTATVRATEPSECFVLKDSDLHLFAFKHPSTLMQMAGALARRIASLNRASVAQA